MSGELGKLLGLFFSFIIALLLLTYLTSFLSQQQCQPYIQQIQQKEAEIENLKQQIAQLNQQLKEYQEKYEQLKNETITKEDIQLLKHYINSTQMQVNLLSQKLEVTNSNFITAYNTYFYIFKFSVIFNFVLMTYIALDLINLALFNTSLNMMIVNKLRIIFKRNK